MAKRIFIIDGHSHIYAAYFAPMSALTSPKGEATKAVYVFTTMILGLIKNEKPEMLVVTMDSKSPSFRNKIYADYKAQRPPMPDDMPGQIGRIDQILGAMKIPVLRVEGFEADDVIGTVARTAAGNGIEAYICSKDKDMLQLIGDQVFVYDTKTGKRYDGEAMLAEMGVRPEQFIDCLALQGDKVDNVPGLPDVGPKTATEWIKKYGSIDNLYAHADEIGGKRGENLRNLKDTVRVSRELVTINCEVPVGMDFEEFALSEPDRAKLKEIFSELGFTRLLTQMSMEDSGSAKMAGGDEDHGQNSYEIRTIKNVAKKYQLIDSEEKFERFLAELKKQDIFAVDTETTSVDAMRADLVGMSFSWKAHEGYYLAIKAPMGGKHLDLKLVREKLGPILRDEKVKKVGQNIKYDMLVLESAGLPIKGVYFDTMVADYVLSDERRSHSMDEMAKDYLNYEPIPISALIGAGRNQLTFDMVDTGIACDYSAEDADVTFRLYQYLFGRLEGDEGLKRLFEDVEMPLVAVLARMELNGVTLDVRLLKSMSHYMAEVLESLTEKIYKCAGGMFNIDSPKQLAEVLFERLGLESVKLGKTGESTDFGVLEQLKEQHEIADLLIQYRQIIKLKNTYVDKLGQLINPRTGRVHASFNQTVTATGRLSSSNPNLQNIPIRTELGKKIRSAFKPEKESDCILSADYSQIELRLLADFSKDKALLHAFAEDQDIHRFVASQVFGVNLDEVTSEMRSRSKAVNFGIIYGQGAFGLSRSLGISVGEAKKFIEDYFARYSSIREFMDKAIAKAKTSGYAETILHRKRKITGLKDKNGSKRSLAERLTINTIIQGSAADLIKVAMINIQRKIDKEKLPIRMILQIHDELVFELPKSEADRHAEWLSKEMTGAIKLDVPLKVDVTIGPTWLG